MNQQKFESLYRAGKAVEGATTVGVSYGRFAELIQALTTEILLAKDRIDTEQERQLVQNPAEIGRLRERPDLVPNAVEEFMRYESPVQFTGRQPLADVEVHGRPIHPGELCLLVVGAANRDPERFAEPARLDVARENAADQLSFGSGRHFCLGAPLARLEGAIAFRKLLPLLDAAELADTDLEWRDSFLNHALESLPLRLVRPS